MRSYFGYTARDRSPSTADLLSALTDDSSGKLRGRGHRIACASGNSMDQHRLLCSKAYSHLAFRPTAASSRRVTPTDRFVASNLGSGRELKHYELHGFVPTDLAWNPRQPLLAIHDDSHNAYRLLDLSTRNLAAPVTVPGRIGFMDWHSDGRLLAIDIESSPQAKITLWDTATKRLAIPAMESIKSPGVIVRFNHAGDRLLSTDWSGLWRLWDARTGQLLLTQPANGVELRLSPDDRWLGLDASPQGTRTYHFESGREFCTVPHGTDLAGFSGDDIRHCQLDDDGRLLALPSSEGLAVVDLVRGEEVAVLPTPSGSSPVAELSGALLTHGSAGLLRWPLARDHAANRRIYGPPEKLAPTITPWPPGGICESSDGHVLAFPASHEGARVLLLPRGETFPIGPQEDVRHCAVSPDGRWVATGSHEALKGPAAKIWDVQGRKLEHELPVSQFCFVSFSPDGKWLLTTGGGARLWSVGDWREGPALGKTALSGAFSGDGGLLALQDVPGVVRVVLPDSGRDIARLTAPEAIRLQPICFTRDGRRLVCRGSDSGLLHIFDLGLIREELAAIRLDWDAPSLPKEQPTPPPVEVQLVGADKLPK